MPAYYTVQSGLTIFSLKEDGTKAKSSGITNPLFGVLVEKTRGHFTHCSQIVKYLRVLSTKTPNKEYVSWQYTGCVLQMNPVGVLHVPLARYQSLYVAQQLERTPKGFL